MILTVHSHTGYKWRMFKIHKELQSIFEVPFFRFQTK